MRRRAVVRGEEMRAIICAALLALTITEAGAADGIDGASANARLPTCKALASDKPKRSRFPSLCRRTTCASCASSLPSTNTRAFNQHSRNTHGPMTLDRLAQM
jgi:hypothetical protein